ncbi:MAG: hypothetical protein LBU74_01975 [Methanobacteriaceae archaeon]|jgi:hypothetical protein|nr:hypothetical protein [Candidatus Methanorudis spinitermitis]
MYKNKYIKNIICLTLLLTVVFLLISTSYADMVPETRKKIDSGKEIITVNNEKYIINWKTDKVIESDRKYLTIAYKSMKNQGKNNYLHISFYKYSKNVMWIDKHYSKSKYGPFMGFSTYNTKKTKMNTDKYYWSKLRPQIIQITKDSILKKETIRYNEIRYHNKTINNSKSNETLTKQYKMNWKVHYLDKTSAIRISKRYIDLTKNIDYNVSADEDIYISKVSKKRLRIGIYTHNRSYARKNSWDTLNYLLNSKYVKTSLSPKQYYLEIYKKKLEKESPFTYAPLTVMF